MAEPATFHLKFLNIGRRLGRPDIMFWTLPYLMILVIIGTIAQKYIGLIDAQMMYFSTLIWWLGPMPLPGGYMVLAVMTINLLCKFIFASAWTKAKFGINLIHFSIIILLVGGLLTAMTASEGFIPLKEGDTRGTIMAFADAPMERGDMTELPFDITLNSFRREIYPGTNMPKEYESRVTVTDGNITWPAVISMNQPLRYEGHTLYQSSMLIDRDGQPVSVLSVVTNKGWVFPYISGVILALGLIYHLAFRMRIGRA
jgi:hypothetical protein